MAGIRLLVLCSLVAAASCQGRGSPSFCLELLKSEDKAQTAKALLKCITTVKQRAANNGGGRFRLPDHYSSIGRCIAEDVGLVNRDGVVNKPALLSRIGNSRKISSVERDYYEGLVPHCDTWDTCLTQHCKI